jgi:hypothetical protein
LVDLLAEASANQMAKEQKLSRELVDHLVELGIRVRVLAIAVEGLGRARGRDQDGIAISAMLVQLSDEIVDVTEMITPSSTAIEH